MMTYKNIDKVLVEGEQKKLLEAISTDLLFLLAYEPKMVASEDKEAREDAIAKVEKRTAMLAEHTINFYAITVEDVFQTLSMSALRERVLAFFKEGNYLEDYAFNLLSERLELKPRYFKKVIKKERVEVVYEMDLVKLRKEIIKK